MTTAATARSVCRRRSSPGSWRLSKRRRRKCSNGPARRGCGRTTTPTPLTPWSRWPTDPDRDRNGDGEPDDDWSFAKVIVRVDAAALDRGEVAPGEVCEIAGQGPLPVADARRMIGHDAFVAAISTNGTEIHKVVHLGRKATALQRTALEWLSAGECSIEGCTSPARLGDRPRRRLGRHQGHPPRRSDRAVRPSPRPQDPPPLPVRAPAGQRQTTTHPTRPEHRPSATGGRVGPTERRTEPDQRRPDGPGPNAARHHTEPGRPLRHRLTGRSMRPVRPARAQLSASEARPSSRSWNFSTLLLAFSGSVSRKRTWRGTL